MYSYFVGCVVDLFENFEGVEVLRIGDILRIEKDFCNGGGIDWEWVGCRDGLDKFFVVRCGREGVRR